MATQVQWTLPAPNATNWVEVQGHTQGDARAQAVASATGGIGPATDGSAVASAEIAVSEGAAGPATEGSAAAQGVASVVGEIGTATNGSAQASALASSDGQEGAATDGSASAPSVIGVSEGAHLKPTHRWQMPLPRQLADSPEDFSTADWSTENGATHDGTTANVGPNGETADKVSYDGTANGGLVQTVSVTNNDDFTVGFYARAVSGTQDVYLSHDDGGTQTDESAVTLDTDWQWVEATINPSGSLDEIALRSDASGSIYLLRASLNRGQSRYFTTDQSVAQTIPDVIAGADLENGSDPGSDTNDLDFGVDAEGIPYAVSDGDDFTDTLSHTDTETWALRVYVPSSVGQDVTFLGDSAYGYPTLVYDDANGDLRIRYKGSGGTTQQGPKVSASEGAWHEVVMTVDGGILRLNVGGTTDSVTGADVAYTADPVLRPDASGARVQHPEVHPVLSESEAEAVRQRLANNPADPVAPTEAWDLSAETSPHNHVPESEDLSAATTTRNANVTTNVGGDSSGSTTMDRITENTQNAKHEVVYKNNISLSTNGEPATIAAEVRQEDSQWVALAAFWDGGVNIGRQWFDLTNNALGSTNGNIIDAAITKISGDLYRIAIVLDTSSSVGEVKLALANADGAKIYTGDGSSSAQFGRVQLCLGQDIFPPYVATSGSIAYPQTVPALRDGSNDLTLGSSSGADTNDGSWIAPIGMAEGGDDRLRTPVRRPTATWIGRVKGTNTRLFGRSANGWKVTATDLVAEDTGGSTASATHGVTIDDGNFHTLAVVVDTVADKAKLYVDAANSPDATVDLSTIGTLKSDDLELLPDGGTLTHAQVATRALSDEDALACVQGFLDHPEEPFPEYTTV